MYHSHVLVIRQHNGDDAPQGHIRMFVKRVLRGMSGARVWDVTKGWMNIS